MENQEIILKYIEDNPGLTQAQITHRLEIPQSTVKYHLLTLVKENKIYSEKLFKTHYFKNGIDDQIKIKSCIKNNNNLKTIFENCSKERSLEEIAISCKISKSMASKRLQVLESLGAVKKIKVEKKVKFCKI
ncbi:winged helix-turn-helix transcriptional regulator [Nitrosopumilus sp.]|nr:winged helix-turn-helix transcriptional regulator [Nitrosopumilus sp.]